MKEYLGESVDDLTGLRLKPKEAADDPSIIQQDTLSDFDSSQEKESK